MANSKEPRSPMMQKKLFVADHVERATPNWKSPTLGPQTSGVTLSVADIDVCRAHGSNPIKNIVKVNVVTS